MLRPHGSVTIGDTMLATPDRYAEMLDGASSGGYAFPAINVTSSQTLNAAIGLARAGPGPVS